MMEQLTVELKERAEEPVAQPHGTSHDRVEDRLHVGRRLADDPQDLARCRLLLECLRLALQRLLQSLLELADPRAFVRQRLAGDRQLDLRFRGLYTPTHSPLPASHWPLRP